MGSRYILIFLSLFSSLFAAGFVTPTYGMNGFESSPPENQPKVDSLPKTRTDSTGHRKMLTLLKRIADQAPDDNPYLGDKMLRTLRNQLDSLPATSPNSIKWRLHMQAGKAALRIGNEADAINHYSRALELTQSGNNRIPQHAVIESHFHLGLAYMRLAETQNCCLRHTPESCILPIRGGGIHIEQDPSRQAIFQFTEVLNRTTDKSPRVFTFGTRWLLNIAYMTIGGYPDNVPREYLIPTHAFESEVDIPRFKNIAPKLGIDVFDLSGGAITDDFDNDGYLDIVVSTWDVEGQIRFFPEPPGRDIR